GYRPAKRPRTQGLNLVDDSLDLGASRREIVRAKGRIEIGCLIEIVMAHEERYLGPIGFRKPIAEKLPHGAADQLLAGLALWRKPDRGSHPPPSAPDILGPDEEWRGRGWAPLALRRGALGQPFGQGGIEPWRDLMG